jgi:predicted secreted protein
MRRALIHITIALLAFAFGVFADDAANRAVDYFFPDPSITLLKTIAPAHAEMSGEGCHEQWQEYEGERYLAVCQ